MSDKPLPFVINDRRKFNSDGQPRETTPEPISAIPEPVPAPGPEPAPTNVVQMPAPASEPEAAADAPEEAQPEPGIPTAEQLDQARRAFEATSERLDLAVRAANPGAEHPPLLSFESILQSVYMQAMIQLGGATQPGQTPQVDLLGARQSIDMLGILLERTAGNLSKHEDALLKSALFELQLGFLEMTQALARSAQQQNPIAPGFDPAGPPPGGRPGPSIVR
jgi:hypothetical protein